MASRAEMVCQTGRNSFESAFARMDGRNNAKTKLFISRNTMHF